VFHLLIYIFLYSGFCVGSSPSRFPPDSGWEKALLKTRLVVPLVNRPPQTWFSRVLIKTTDILFTLPPPGRRRTIASFWVDAPTLRLHPILSAVPHDFMSSAGPRSNRVCTGFCVLLSECTSPDCVPWSGVRCALVQPNPAALTSYQPSPSPLSPFHELVVDRTPLRPLVPPPHSTYWASQTVP